MGFVCPTPHAQHSAVNSSSITLPISETPGGGLRHARVCAMAPPLFSFFFLFHASHVSEVCAYASRARAITNRAKVVETINDFSLATSLATQRTPNLPLSLVSFLFGASLLPLPLLSPPSIQPALHLNHRADRVSYLLRSRLVGPCPSKPTAKRHPNDLDNHI